MSWQELENQVRTIAESRWNCNAIAETVASVKCDCVLKPDFDRWIAIEVTEERNLQKVREDISKLQTVRNMLFSQSNIYCACYIVMKDTPTDSMRQSAEAQRVKLMSLEEFRKEYFDYQGYVHIRLQKQFGSLINIETGEPEENIYINVNYYNAKNNKDYRINDIIDMLKKGRHVVLKGDFGVGKSRCIKQIFDIMKEEKQEGFYTIPINLRDHWGAKRGVEVLLRHFEDLGIDAKNFLKNYEKPNIIYLLDGFDEIGTQSWSSDIRKMQHIREMSVCALKDLIQNAQGGCLIVGRDYYFNSDQELMNCLGLSEETTTFLECHNEFTEEELLDYFKNNVPENLDRGRLAELPVWFPRRPLITQLLLKYASDIFSVDYALNDICSFWYVFLQKMCEREARIYPALNPEVIEQVLLILADKTREGAGDTGPITQNDLSAAFEEAAGFQPNDESAIMLQRLPSLGRINADSPDRQFLDLFILNGLRAESIIRAVKSWNMSITSKVWIIPLDTVGYDILAQYINKDEKNLNQFLGMARQAINAGNMVLASDIVAAISYLDVDGLDYKGLCISDGHIKYLSFEGKNIRGLEILQSVIEKIDLTNAKLEENVIIKDCIISTILGIASYKGIPEQIKSCDVESFQAMATTTLIKKAKLSSSQKIFITMIRKIFYQPGAGRKEEALLRGLGAATDKRCAEKILNKLLDEKIITRHKGDEGYIYKPVRKYTAQMDKILTDLTLSKDPLWIMISGIS